MMVAKIIVDKLEMYIMSLEDGSLQNKDSTFWIAGSDITHPVLERS